MEIKNQLAIKKRQWIFNAPPERENLVTTVGFDIKREHYGEESNDALGIRVDVKIRMLDEQTRFLVLFTFTEHRFIFEDITVQDLDETTIYEMLERAFNANQIEIARFNSNDELPHEITLMPSMDACSQEIEDFLAGQENS